MTPLPYGRQWITAEDEAAVVAALRSDWLTQGPRVEEFEAGLARATGARHAVAVSSGTAALHLAYLAVGVAPGQVVATSPLTFVATANAAVYCGARPEFVDVEPDTLCLSPRALEKRLEGGWRPAVVVPVHFAGLPADLDKIGALAERFGFAVVEDACHALGARSLLRGAWGTVGDGRVAAATVLSFHPVKHITSGEGGAVLTNHDEVARRVRTLRSHGVAREGFRCPEQCVGPGGAPRPWYYEMQDLGFNYRITDLQCALGLAQLARLPDFVKRRRELAARYAASLAPLVSEGLLRLPAEVSGRESSWHLYPVRIPSRRDEAYLALREAGILAQVHYTPVHLQPYYRESFGTGPGDCPAAEAYFEEGLSLPLFPAMGDDDLDRVVDRLAISLRTARGTG